MADGLETFTGPAGELRAKGVAVVVPVVIGTQAFHLGKPPDEYAHTHKWFLYLRSPDGRDLADVVSGVTFLLHPSFPEPTRTFKTGPFQVEEQGWGEFEILVKLAFAADAQEKEIEILHRLKLYEEDPALQARKQEAGEPVVREQYEEIIFSEPPVDFYKRVTAAAPRQAPALHRDVIPHLTSFSEDADVAAITAARDKIAAMRDDLLRNMG